MAHGLELSFPVITNYESATMRFVPWKIRTKFATNRYAIPEPIGAIMHMELRQPDLILLPLLGFDKKGNRIGMGGGFYDRYLGNLPSNKTPHLIGLAFNNQQIDSIITADFDIPVDGVLTETGLQYLHR